MVYITDEEGTVRKFACLTCIKGHRSSGCQHAERELMEIRKKGRPVSQCAHCRNLRKTKQVHIKCLCHKKSDVLSSLTSSSAPSPPRTTTTTTTTTINTIGSPTSIVTPTTTLSPSPQSASPVSAPAAPENHQPADPMQRDPKVQNLLSKPCARCDRSPSYCICTYESRSNQADYGYLSSSSSDGTLTPPITTTSISSPLASFELHHDGASTSMSTSSLSSSSSTTSQSLRLVIPSNASLADGSDPASYQHHQCLYAHMESSPSPSYESLHSSATSSRHGSPFATPTPTTASTATPTTAKTPMTGTPFSPKPQHPPLQHTLQHPPLQHTLQHTTLSSPAGLQSIIPIHDPSDDLDSDTPVYKSEEQTIDQSAVLGELTNRTSEELMNQIYNEFSAETYHLSHPPVDFDTDEMDYHQEVPSSSTSRRSSYQCQPTPTSYSSPLATSPSAS